VTPVPLPREGWTREYANENVCALREYLEENNGIKGLEICEPHEVERAVRIFHRDGFVAVQNALSPEILEKMRMTTDRAIMQAIESGPPAELRYSIGGSSASRHWLHDDAYCALIDMPTTTPILTAIFGSADYLVGGAGGDCALPGAIEYQSLHKDGIWQEPYDPQGKLTLTDYPVPVVTINFQMCDTTPINGPIRQIPGTHKSHEPLPEMADEPAWMKLSTVCPAPAGTALFRDNRCWHGGTPNCEPPAPSFSGSRSSSMRELGTILTRAVPHLLCLSPPVLTLQ
jgi:hypothetical protein